MAKRRYSSRSRRRSGKNLNQGYFIAGLLFLAVALFAATGDSGITGYASSDDVGLNISVGNNNPTIINVSTVPAQNPTEATTTGVVISFNASDIDGVDQLTNGTVTVTNASTSHTNVTCTDLGNVNSTTANFECTIFMNYFDPPGIYNINVTIVDSNGGQAQNVTTTFTYNQLLAMVLAPDNLTWASLALTDVNSTSTNDETQINNTGNANANLSVTALNLAGETTSSDLLNAENFTVSTHTGGGSCSGIGCTECNGSVQSHNAAINISNATLPRGNFSVADDSTGKEYFYYCLLALNQSISSQSYSSSFLGSWVVTANAL